MISIVPPTQFGLEWLDTILKVDAESYERTYVALPDTFPVLSSEIKCLPFNTKPTYSRLSGVRVPVGRRSWIVFVQLKENMTSTIAVNDLSRSLCVPGCFIIAGFRNVLPKR